MKLLQTFVLAALFMAQNVVAQTKQDILTQIEKVNDYWQSHNTAKCRGFWDNAAYFTGNQEVYNLTGKQAYLD